MTSAFVFCYERPDTLRACCNSLFMSSKLPDKITFIDDGSRDPAVERILKETVHLYGNRTQLELILKGENIGFRHSAMLAWDAAVKENPDFLYLIESDYIYEPMAFDVIDAVFHQSEQGRNCLGIAGYSHPMFRNPESNRIFSNGMIHSLGEDNVNRAALFKPKPVQAGQFQLQLELTSNTCFSAYLNWKRIFEVAAEFPELAVHFKAAFDSSLNPEFERFQYADDAMLSASLSLSWNRYALKHGLDRDQFAAWISIIPSVADHCYVGGIHT